MIDWSRTTHSEPCDETEQAWIAEQNSYRASDDAHLRDVRNQLRRLIRLGANADSTRAIALLTSPPHYMGRP